VNAGQRAGVGLVKHITAAEKLLGALLAQNCPAVDPAGYLEADPCRQVRFDHAGDDID
jgi:hypothetical protein